MSRVHVYMHYPFASYPYRRMYKYPPLFGFELACTNTLLLFVFIGGSHRNWIRMSLPLHRELVKHAYWGNLSDVCDPLNPVISHVGSIDDGFEASMCAQELSDLHGYVQRAYQAVAPGKGSKLRDSTRSAVIDTEHDGVYSQRSCTGNAQIEQPGHDRIDRERDSIHLQASYTDTTQIQQPGHDQLVSRNLSSWEQKQIQAARKKTNRLRLREAEQFERLQHTMSMVSSLMAMTSKGHTRNRILEQAREEVLENDSDLDFGVSHGKTCGNGEVVRQEHARGVYNEDRNMSYGKLNDMKDSDTAIQTLADAANQRTGVKLTRNYHVESKREETRDTDALYLGSELVSGSADGSSASADSMAQGVHADDYTARGAHADESSGQGSHATSGDRHVSSRDKHASAQERMDQQGPISPTEPMYKRVWDIVRNWKFGGKTIPDQNKREKNSDSESGNSLINNENRGSGEMHVSDSDPGSKDSSDRGKRDCGSGEVISDGGKAHARDKRQKLPLKKVHLQQSSSTPLVKSQRRTMSPSVHPERGSASILREIDPQLPQGSTTHGRQGERNLGSTETKRNVEQEMIGVVVDTNEVMQQTAQPQQSVAADKRATMLKFARIMQDFAGIDWSDFCKREVVADSIETDDDHDYETSEYESEGKRNDGLNVSHGNIDQKAHASNASAQDSGNKADVHSRNNITKTHNSTDSWKTKDATIHVNFRKQAAQQKRGMTTKKKQRFLAVKGTRTSDIEDAQAMAQILFSTPGFPRDGICVRVPHSGADTDNCTSEAEDATKNLQINQKMFTDMLLMFLPSLRRRLGPEVRVGDASKRHNLTRIQQLMHDKFMFLPKMPVAHSTPAGTVHLAYLPEKKVTGYVVPEHGPGCALHRDGSENVAKGSSKGGKGANVPLRDQVLNLDTAGMLRASAAGRVRIDSDSACACSCVVQNLHNGHETAGFGERDVIVTDVSRPARREFDVPFLTGQKQRSGPCRLALLCVRV
jgi:hypothetical protein